ncbi:MAG: hypothetical protein IPJ18_18955 [Betaproteobacteria bacterium]|nr:hypothetical protein [Betaproteobacteria bacterium]
MAAPLLKLTSGYALWGARDYDASMLFNGFFSLAGLGWESGGSAQFASGSATLAIGASIRQMVPEKLNQRAYTKQTRLRILVSGPGIIEARFAGVTKSAQVPTGPSWIHFDFLCPMSTVTSTLPARMGSLCCAKRTYTITRRSPIFGILLENLGRGSRTYELSTKI